MVVAAAVMAAELSLISALSAGHLVRAHMHLNRKPSGKDEGGAKTLTVEELKAKDAVDLKAKQEAAAKKARAQEELDAKNDARDAELAKQGKRAAGGVHKFDPDEVDVHGGNATADDFMDAFGF